MKRARGSYILSLPRPHFLSVLVSDMFRIQATPRFERMLARFVKAHPELRQKTLTLVSRLAKNPYDSGNKTHRLSGKLKGCLAASISLHYRVVFLIVEDALWLLSIGSHDEVY